MGTRMTESKQKGDLVLLSLGSLFRVFEGWMLWMLWMLVCNIYIIETVTMTMYITVIVKAAVRIPETIGYVVAMVPSCRVAIHLFFSLICQQLKCQP